MSFKNNVQEQHHEERPAQKRVVLTPPSPKPLDDSYKNKSYWNLPENVRNAIDVAKSKSRHSEFYYKLQNLNDKIYVFRSIFYNKVPSY